jgi:hypothetical protein
MLDQFTVVFPVSNSQLKNVAAPRWISRPLLEQADAAGGVLYVINKYLKTLREGSPCDLHRPSSKLLEKFFKKALTQDKQELKTMWDTTCKLLLETSQCSISEAVQAIAYSLDRLDPQIHKDTYKKRNIIVAGVVKFMRDAEATGPIQDGPEDTKGLQLIADKFLQILKKVPSKLAHSLSGEVPYTAVNDINMEVTIDEFLHNPSSEKLYIKGKELLHIAQTVLERAGVHTKLETV